MSKKEIEEIISYAYSHDDDYVNWTYVQYLKDLLKSDIEDIN